MAGTIAAARGVRRAGDMLVRPQLGENIGTAAEPC